MNRRDVMEGLLLGAAVGAAVLAPAASAAVPEKLQTARRIIVFDGRFAAARQFGVEAGPQAWLIRSIRGDVTPLWHDLLEAQWQRHATAIHGMTTPRAFQCLEQLVADRFWRVTSLAPVNSLIRWALAPARNFA
jgi:hypothetical protein